MNLKALLLTTLAPLALSAQEPMRPFEIVWNSGGASAADMSSLLDAPAGGRGFVQVKNGHLADGSGRRLRIWGVNFAFTASLTSKQNAPAVAAHLAHFGVNCVRIHHLDWRVPQGIVDARFPDSRHLAADRLDRLDFMVSELKKRGIYVNLNLNVARAFQPGDEVADAGRLGFAKAITLFDARIVELEREYARQLLTHRNPYTGNEYRAEPAVAMVEIVNENSIVESWKGGRLQGCGPQPDQRDTTWSDITGHYAQELTGLWQQYLEQHLAPAQVAALRKEAGVEVGAPVPRLRPDQFAAASQLRFRSEASFYIDLESRFFEGMGRYLKSDIGVRVPMIGTSAHNGGMSPYPLLESTSQLDIIDAHTYWQHPSYGTDAATGRQTFSILNTPMVNQPGKSTVAALNRAAFAGKPFVVSEVNHPYPSEWAAEMIPVLAAYGAFLDWDGIFWYAFSHQDADQWRAGYPGHFDIRQDPVKMAQLAAAAALFLRGDVAPARQMVARAYTPGQVRDSLRLPSAEAPAFTPGMPPGLPLVHATRIASLRGGAAPAWPAVNAPYRSDTGELTWMLEGGKGLVTIDTPRTQGVTGFLGGRSANTANLELRVENAFAALLAVSMDSKPIARAERLLLTAGARTGNTGMRWNAERTTLLETGGAPMLIELVRGAVVLKGIEGASGVDVEALDGAGRPLGAPEPAARTSDGWRIPLGAATTPWYRVTVRR